MDKRLDGGGAKVPISRIPSLVSWIWGWVMVIIRSCFTFLVEVLKLENSSDHVLSSLQTWLKSKDSQKRVKVQGALEVFPQELWKVIADKVIDTQDWLNFIRLSPDLEKLMEHKKVEKLFPKICSLKSMSKYLANNDLLNLRLVSSNLRDSLDSEWTNAPPDLMTWTIPTVFLTSLLKVSRFTKEMDESQDSRIIPFGIFAGVGSPNAPDYSDWNEDILNELTVRIFWNAFARCIEKIGHRIHYVIFDIRIDPSMGSKFTEDIVNIIVMNCLKRLSNLKHLAILTNTGNVERAMSGIYSYNDADRCQRMPSLDQLETLDILTLSEGHPSKSKFKAKPITTFPSRFLHHHGSKIVALRVASNLYDFKTMGAFPASNLEWIKYDIHHCMCQGKEADLKALLTIPIVDQTDIEGCNTRKLKSVTVKVNWQWRTSDISSFFKWLGRNYPDHKLDELILRNDRKDLKTLWEQHKTGRMKKENILVGSAYGSAYPWIGKIKLPQIKSFELSSEYSGSWMFLIPFRDSLERLVLQRQEFYRCEELMTETYTKGLLNDIFGVDFCSEVFGSKPEKHCDIMVIWDYFPSLKEFVVFWQSMNQKMFNLNFSDIQDEPDLKYIDKKEYWKVTREQFNKIRSEE